MTMLVLSGGPSLFCLYFLFSFVHFGCVLGTKAKPGLCVACVFLVLAFSFEFGSGFLLCVWLAFSWFFLCFSGFFLLGSVFFLSRFSLSFSSVSPSNSPAFLPLCAGFSFSVPPMIFGSIPHLPSLFLPSSLLFSSFSSFFPPACMDYLWLL